MSKLCGPQTKLSKEEKDALVKTLREFCAGDVRKMSKWFNSSNINFGGSRPVQMMEGTADQQRYLERWIKNNMAWERHNIN